MQSATFRPVLRPLVAAAGVALSLWLSGCAVPVTDGYAYDDYGYVTPYPQAPYVVPGGPPVIYGAPPVYFDGGVWVDRPPRWRDDHRRPGWRDEPRRPPIERPQMRPPERPHRGDRPDVYVPTPAERAQGWDRTYPGDRGDGRRDPNGDRPGRGSRY